MYSQFPHLSRRFFKGLIYNPRDQFGQKLIGSIKQGRKSKGRRETERNRKTLLLTGTAYNPLQTRAILMSRQSRSWLLSKPRQSTHLILMLLVTFASKCQTLVSLLGLNTFPLVHIQLLSSLLRDNMFKYIRKYAHLLQE